MNVLRILVVALVISGLNELRSAIGQTDNDLPAWSREYFQTPQTDDLIGFVEDQQGQPVKGVVAKVQIQRTVGFFTGSGTPPILTRLPSNRRGELRFASPGNWRDWIEWELEALAEKKDQSGNDVPEPEFTAFRWEITGYWPDNNSLIRLESEGKPELWPDERPVRFVLPELHAARIQVVSQPDDVPLANVRLSLRLWDGKPKDSQWSRVTGNAWTDATGSAVVWIPDGSYRVSWDSTFAIEGIDAASELFEIDQPVFGAPPKQFGPLSRRQKAMRIGQFSVWPDAPLLQIRGKPSDIYKLRLERPANIIP